MSTYICLHLGLYLGICDDIFVDAQALLHRTKVGNESLFEFTQQTIVNVPTGLRSPPMDHFHPWNSFGIR